MKHLLFLLLAIFLWQVTATAYAQPRSIWYWRSQHSVTSAYRSVSDLTEPGVKHRPILEFGQIERSPDLKEVRWRDKICRFIKDDTVWARVQNDDQLADFIVYEILNRNNSAEISKRIDKYFYRNSRAHFFYSRGGLSFQIAPCIKYPPFNSYWGPYITLGIRKINDHEYEIFSRLLNGDKHSTIPFKELEND